MNLHPPNNSRPADRPTLRMFAARAGVSPMTVSRALGNGLRIADDPRRKILKIAEDSGYRPDPELSKLMHHLRRRRRSIFQSVICAITTRPAGEKAPYSDDKPDADEPDGTRYEPGT